MTMTFTESNIAHKADDAFVEKKRDNTKVKPTNAMQSEAKNISPPVQATQTYTKHTQNTKKKQTKCLKD